MYTLSHRTEYKCRDADSNIILVITCTSYQKPCEQMPCLSYDQNDT